MMINVGAVDRGIRLVLGAALIAAALFSELIIFDVAVMKYSGIFVGLVMVVTSLMGTCPVYSFFGIRTCKM